MNAPNFAAVLEDLDDLRIERQEAVREAEYEVKQAERRLALAELDTDMRTWTQDEHDEYCAASAEVCEAYTNLRKARAAL
jgi:hypothetical protein